MTTESDQHPIRWLLAAWEGLIFGWFVFITYFAAQTVIQVAEFVWNPLPHNRLPKLTVWMQNVFPEESWSLLIGIPAFSIGFGLISLTSNEAPASRLFRWAIVAVFTMLVSVALPAMKMFTNLSGGPDGRIWDEVLFIGLALATLAYGIIRLRRQQQQQP